MKLTSQILNATSKLNNSASRQSVLLLDGLNMFIMCSTSASVEVNTGQNISLDDVIILLQDQFQSYQRTIVYISLLASLVGDSEVMYCIHFFFPLARHMPHLIWPDCE